MLRLQPALVCSAFFTAMTLAGSVQTALAAPFVLQALAGANLGCTVGTTCPGNDEMEVIDEGLVSASLSSATDDVDDPYFTYSAEAFAEFGRLHARASGDYDLPSASTRLAGAAAVATDLLTISDPLLNGQAGTLEISFLLDGILEHSAGAGAVAWVAVTVGQDPDPFSGNNQEFDDDFLTVPASSIGYQVDFVFGQPFYLSLFLGVAAGTPMTCFVCNGGDTDAQPATGIGSANADFFSTLVLSGMLPRDANGNPVLDAQFASASNTRYSVEGVVPEPGSLLLLGTGLALTFRRFRRG